MKEPTRYGLSPMRLPRIEAALGVDGVRDDRLAWKIVLALCALYAVSFVAFYPRVVTNDDESLYLRQTLIVLEGMQGINRIDAVTGEAVVYTPSTYPPGTVLTMAPFVALAGWRGGYVVPFLSLMLAVILLARWLQNEGRSPLFALLLLGYPPALVMGRVAMSDVPSAAIVTLGLLLFFRGIDRGWPWWLASGFVAGGSMLFRESNPIPFAPFFAGTVLRRDRRAWALVVGGLAGLSLRLVTNLALSDDPLFYRSPYKIALDRIDERLPIYLFATLVLIPGGLLFSVLYRGRRWPELCFTVPFFVAAYVVQTHYTYSAGWLKNSVNTPRYVLPIIPVMVFAMAECVPRLWRSLVARADAAWRGRLVSVAPRFVTLWVLGVALAAIAVHPAFSAWSATQGTIRDAIAQHVERDAVMVTNYMATRKFIDEIGRSYLPVPHDEVGVDGTDVLVDRYGEVYLVLLDRTDSAYWRRRAASYREFVSQLAHEPELVYELEASRTDHLRIWRLRSNHRRDAPEPREATAAPEG